MERCQKGVEVGLRICSDPEEKILGRLLCLNTSKRPTMGLSSAKVIYGPSHVYITQCRKFRAGAGQADTELLCLGDAQWNVAGWPTAMLTRASMVH